ncbi:HAMP domain-containing sensor histidine kinase [Paenibacillus tuaregi]|uniref:HAMP domain-containing sensor histidine kinase n=1 Tax=Paenibacillus tuaregi TaxID=1816681 RepID=UPI00083958CB|nr:HAMP domain-containing sensor histidine kinase [Paenibacillus tuaregi]
MAKPKKIQKTLIQNFVFFSLTVTLLAVMVMFYFNHRITTQLITGMSSHLTAGDIVRTDYKKMDTEAIESLEGWVEILDDKLNVVYTHGAKRDGTFRYTDKDIYGMFYDHGEREYSVSLAPFKTREGRTYHCLVKIPKKHVESSLTITDQAKDQTAAFWRLLLEAALLFVFLFAIIVYIYSRWTARSITNPLRYIAEGIWSVARGKYGKRLNFEANLELIQIQERFNAMADKLERTEREKKQLEMSKQRMLVDISHDLKTPITMIRGYAQAMQLGLIEEERKERTIRLIHDKSQLVAELIDDVFELSKLESPDYPVEMANADLAEFVRKLAVDYYDAFIDKDFVVEIDIPSAPVAAEFNARLLYRAVSNLFENAVKYNPPGTKVVLVLKEEPDTVQIEVSDNGTGIPSSQREHVFEAFVRGDPSRKSDGGTGLGLTIARQIIQKHGGTITLEPVKGWTMFRIVLPKRQADGT